MTLREIDRIIILRRSDKVRRWDAKTQWRSLYEAVNTDLSG